MANLNRYKFTNILIRVVIPRNSPFLTGVDALCAIVYKICVKNMKITVENGGWEAILNPRT